MRVIGHLPLTGPSGDDWAVDCTNFCVMPIRYTKPKLTARRKPETGRMRRSQQRPSGRHGGPSAIPRPRTYSPLNNALTATLVNESFVIGAPFEKALRRARRALSRQDIHIARECDISSRINKDSDTKIRECRVLYVTRPCLLERAISIDPSAALWLPLPVVVADEGESTRITFPSEGIVRDRATLLGIREQVRNFYKDLTTALQAISVQEQIGTESSASDS